MLPAASNSLSNMIRRHPLTAATLPARTAHGELDIRIDGCDGPRIASAPLPASPAADGFAVVEAAWSSPVEGARDLCIRFSGDTRPAMWVLDTLTLLPAATE